MQINNNANCMPCSLLTVCGHAQIGFKMVTQREFSSNWFTTAFKSIGQDNIQHRKQWELACALQ